MKLSNPNINFTHIFYNLLVVQLLLMFDKELRLAANLAYYQLLFRGNQITIFASTQKIFS